MGRRNITWILSELPTLEAEEVIDGATADRIRNHYNELNVGSSRRLAVAVFAVFGALLIGGGVILLLAHNWEAFGRGTRATIALLPLLAAQTLVGWVLLKRSTSTAWREGSATLLALTVAAAIALVDQTYHTGGDLESFLWRWSLLLAPLPWLLNSTAVAMLFLGSLTWWAGAARAEGSQYLWMWPLAAAVVPHLVQVLRRGRRGLRAANLQWAVALFLCVAAGVGLVHRVPGLWIVVYVALFALMIGLGAANRESEVGLWRRPFEAIGVAGSVILWLLLSFDDPWKHIGWKHLRPGEDFNGSFWWVDVVVAVGLPLAAIAVIALLLDRRRHRLTLVWCLSVPLVAVVWPLVAASNEPWFGMVAFTVLLFGVGIQAVVEGVRHQNLGLVNLGMVVVAILVVVRFFDSNIGFILKGLAFILVGIGFLVANIVLSRRLRAGKREVP